jgi:hypothetical protein
MNSFSYNSQTKYFNTFVDMDFFLFWCVELVPKICPHLSLTACINFGADYFRLWKTRMSQTRSCEAIVSLGSEDRHLQERITYRHWFTLKHTAGQEMKDEWGTHLKQKHLI